MRVVIVESPAKAKTINKYLGSEYQVLASFGHIRDLPSRNGSVEPDNDFMMHYEISADSQRHVKALSDAVKKATHVYLATDPDREGEAISWHITEALKEKKALKKDTQLFRVTFNEITKSAVTHAMAHPRSIDMELVNAQQARRALDYLVGFNLSPVLWRKLPGSKSAGRVQSVALRLICEREAAIETFVTQEYWKITAEFQTEHKEQFQALLTHLEGKKLDKFDLNNEALVQQHVQHLKQKQYAVTDIETKQQRRFPPAPFMTSSLQQEASRKLGFSAKRTMQIAQRLYEGVEVAGETIGLITYMRTDGVQVSAEAIATARKTIADQFGANYVPEKARHYTSKAKNAQEAHEAIRPTRIDLAPDAIRKYLDDDQMKLYDLIWKRMVASQMAEAILDLTAFVIDAKDHSAGFRATGSILRFDGFYRLYHEGKDDDEDEENRALPASVKKGNPVTLLQMLPSQHFTEPPPRYSEASLVGKLEELGIGRPSTYASIISVLQERDYVRLEKKRFIPEDRGRLVTSFLESFFRRYVEYNFTADLETQLDQISAGELDWKKMLRQFWNDFYETTHTVSQQDMASVLEALNQNLEHHIFPKQHGQEEGTNPRQCPSCKTGELSLKLSRFGAFIGCSHYPECRYTRPFITNNEEGQEAEGLSEYPRLIGEDPTTHLPITLRKGPYGFYLQLGEAEGDAKPKRYPLPKSQAPDLVSMEVALSLMALPREVGHHPETGESIVASIGRFGPYLLYQKRFYTLPKEDDVLTVGINRAVTVIADKDSGKNQGASSFANSLLRTVGNHPQSGEAIAIYKGRYGPFIKAAGLNISLPKTMDIEHCTIDELVALIEKKLASGSGAKKASPVKKAAAKKSSIAKAEKKTITAKKK